MEISVWFYFALACFGLALTPGPNAMLVMTNSVRFGPGVTFYTIAGGVVCFIGLMVVSLLGIDTLLKAYPAALNYIKLAGGLYLIGLGIRQWMLSKIEMNTSIKSINRGTKFALFTQGAISAASNPKVFLFFAAFLTQFINPQRELLSQFIVMILTFALAEFIVETIINLTAGRFRTALAKHGQYFCFFCGTLFITIGVIVLLTGLI